MANNEENGRQGFTRRTFLKAGAVAGAAAAASGVLAACAPGKSRGEGGGSGAQPTAADAVTQRLIDRGVVGANLPEAAPIPPVEPPASWDGEADVVVVGLGGGGLVASGWLTEQGVSVIGINGNRLALALGFDPSYISRIRAGQRRPADVAQFSAQVARFVAFNCTDAKQVERVAALTGAAAHEVAKPEARETRVREWLASGAAAVAQEQSVAQPLSRFLATLDAFDLNAFMEEIHFDEIRVPTLPFQLPTRKTYTGIDEMKQAELDFYRAAILSKSTDDVYLYSDMPLEEMALDKEFPKQIMKSVALLIRKGVRIVNIHDVHRPTDELFMGLEGWVPVYMTGLMESYYLPAPTNTAFLHFLRSAGSVACGGEAIRGDQGSGRYVLTKAAADVAYYRTRATQLLAQARPLLKVFTEDMRDERDKALGRLHGTHGDGTVTVGEGDFSTLSITALPGRYVLISKSNPPAVDMLVEHPALVDAFERYEPRLF